MFVDYFIILFVSQKNFTISVAQLAENAVPDQIQITTVQAWFKKLSLHQATTTELRPVILLSHQNDHHHRRHRQVTGSKHHSVEVGHVVR